MEKRVTHEYLSKKFKNRFDLVNYAIKLAENMIKSGRDGRVRSETQNRAMIILGEIDEGKDVFDEIVEKHNRNDEVDLQTVNKVKIFAEEPIERRSGKALAFED